MEDTGEGQEVDKDPWRSVRYRNYVLTWKGTSGGHVYGRLYIVRSYGIYLWTEAARAQHVSNVSVMTEAARVYFVIVSSQPIQNCQHGLCHSLLTSPTAP